ERKLAKKAAKAARKVEKLQAKEAAKVNDDGATRGEKGKKEKSKKDRELLKQILELETKRHNYLAELKKLDAQVQQMLEQADDADKVAKWVAKAIEETSDEGAGEQSSKLTPDDDDVSEADSSGGKNPDTADGEKKKKKDKKKKSKSKAEEPSAVEGQASDGKRKRQDDSAEQPASKKGKKAKGSKGGEQEAHAAAEEVKIEGLEGGKARQDKFMRLLGGKKAGVSTAQPGSLVSKSQGGSVRAEAAIQQQFEAGMALKESGHKRRGLGA
ncbi:hypothetical protein BBK36DRAFT_1183491, partial [Trichoderma citrinoviride]